MLEEAFSRCNILGNKREYHTYVPIDNGLMPFARRFKKIKPKITTKAICKFAVTCTFVRYFVHIFQTVYSKVY